MPITKPTISIENAVVQLCKESGNGGFYSLRVNNVHIWRFNTQDAENMGVIKNLEVAAEG